MIKKIALSLSFFLLFGLLFFYFFQEKFIFLNGNKLDKNYKYHFKNTFEELFLKTEDDKRINALHFKLPNPKGVVLFCHGNKGNLKRWGKRVDYLLDYNYEILVYDYRNYGKSSGSFDEEQMYKDGLLFYKHLKKEFTEDKIVVYGYSLGSTFATRIAALNNPKELVLEAPFYNLKRATQYFLSLAPTFLLKYHFKTNIDFPKVKVPITVFHGDEDKTTSFKQSKELFALNASKENMFVGIPTGTHHNILSFEVYQERLKEILER